MQNSTIRYSQCACTVLDKQGQVVGKILFQREQHFKVWRIRYLSDQLPINSFDRAEDVREKLENHELTWRWGPVRHYYGYDR